MKNKDVEDQDILTILHLISKWNVGDLHCLERIIKILKEIKIKKPINI